MYNDFDLNSEVYLCENGVDENLFYFEKDHSKSSRNLTACWVGNSSSMANKGLNLIKAACDRS